MGLEIDQDGVSVEVMAGKFYSIVQEIIIR
jgi:biotin operon repressor